MPKGAIAANKANRPKALFRFIRDRARELDWLREDLKLSPVADPPLLGLAERLVKLSPDDVQKIHRAVFRLQLAGHHRSG